MDAFGEIGVFVRVVEARSFTRAGKLLGVTASGVSRVISRLEARLGVRLLDRTTRSIGLTADGASYYERCARILGELQEAHTALARASGAPRGRLRVDAPTVLGHHVLGPAIPRFLAAYPELSLDLSVRDHVIDPIAEGIDVVLRMAELRESELLCRKLGALRTVVVASPRYLDARGRPREPRDLRQHDTMSILPGPASLPWRFRTAGRDHALPFTGRLHTNDIDTIRAAAVAGLGVAWLLDIHVRAEIEDGTLEVLLEEHEPPPISIHALYGRDKAALPKVRAFLEFAEEQLRAGGVARKRAARRKRGA